MAKKKLTTTEKLLFAFPVAILALPFLLRATRPLDFIARFDPRGDALDKAMRKRAGYSLDCGSVAVGASTAAADACAVAAFTAKRPFHVRYYERGVDSIVARGLAGTAGGKLYQYGYDSDPSGGGNVGESVSEGACPNPEIHSTSTDTWLVCKPRF